VGAKVFKMARIWPKIKKSSIKCKKFEGYMIKYNCKNIFNFSELV